jgi:hypothetical protein
LGREHCPLSAVPKTGWGNLPAAHMLGHFNKEPVNGSRSERIGEETGIPQLPGCCRAGSGGRGRRGRIGGEKSNLTSVFGCSVRAV